MSLETVTMDWSLSEDTSSSTDLATPLTTLSNENELPTSTEESFNISTEATAFSSEYPETMSAFEAFMITEIIMTAIELLISIVAIIKIPRWRKNYRNQMLMQLSLARFIKRVILLFKFYDDQRTDKKSGPFEANIILYISQVYIDFVIVVLVFFFIKHMYDSLIIVVVKINQGSLNKTSIYAWSLPVLITAIWTIIIVTKVLDEWYVYLLICCLFRWPLIFLGTMFYINIVYKVLSDKIRRFARSLTIVTFLMCLVTNFYLLSKDIIELWCFKTAYLTILINYISGFLLNFFILCIYVILIILNLNHNTNSSRSLPDYSLAEGSKPSKNVVLQ